MGPDDENIYSLGLIKFKRKSFVWTLSIKVIQFRSFGLYSAGEIKNKIYLKVMNLIVWILSWSNILRAFDFVEGYTVYAANGKIIFPVLEPFGSHLRKAFNDDAIAKNMFSGVV